MPAGVQERAREAVRVGDEDDGRRAEPDHHVLARLTQLVDVPGAHPLAGEDLVQLPVQDVVIRERRARELRGALQREQGPLDRLEGKGQLGHGAANRI